MKHLELIHSIIARLSTNSFTIKGWGITLASALLGFGVTTKSASLAILAALPTALFWGLDAYYLGLERLYRDRYQKVLTTDEVPALDVSLGADQSRGKAWARSLLATPVLALYGMLILVNVAAFVMLKTAV